MKLLIFAAVFLAAWWPLCRWADRRRTKRKATRDARRIIAETNALVDARIAADAQSRLSLAGLAQGARDTTGPSSTPLGVVGGCVNRPRASLVRPRLWLVDDSGTYAGTSIRKKGRVH